MIGLASVPRTESSLLLVSDAIDVVSVTVIDRPAGMVTSRNAGVRGAAGVEGGATDLAGAAGGGSGPGAALGVGEVVAGSALFGSDAAGAGGVDGVA